MRLLEIENLSINYGNKPVIKDVSFHISEAEIITLIGPNGAGKSTLLGAIFSLPKAARGTIKKRPGLKIGYMPQSLVLNPLIEISVKGLMSLPMRFPMSEIKAALAEVDAEHLLDSSIHALSGGQMRRVLLAHALLGRPDLLILDEPTANFDQNGIAKFYTLIAELRRRYKTAILMVSHDLYVVMRDSDKVICLNKHICCQGKPEALETAPEYRAFFDTHQKEYPIAFYQHRHKHNPADSGLPNTTPNTIPEP